MNATATREIRRVRLRALARLRASDAFRARTRQCDGARGMSDNRTKELVVPIYYSEGGIIHSGAAPRSTAQGRML
jgi:hypothetical protein